MKTKPFNLEEALANPDRVICRDGVKREWHYFKTCITSCPITVIDQGIKMAVDKRGLCESGNGNNDRDLLLTCETKIVPFTYETFLPHKDRWVKCKSWEGLQSIDLVCKDFVRLGGTSEISWKVFMQDYEFEDGTPCGVEVEE